MLRARSKLILLILVGACDDGRPEVERLPAPAAASVRTAVPVSAASFAVPSAFISEPAAPWECEPWSSADSCMQRWTMPFVPRHIRGTDDRLDLYCLESKACGYVHDGLAIREAARASLAIFDEKDLDKDEVTGAYTINPTIVPLGDFHEPGGSRWCGDEVFMDQARGAACSGVLIEGPRILSARHCLQPERVFVLGFALTGPQSPRAFQFAGENVCRPRRGAEPQRVNDEVAVLDIECEGASKVVPAPIAAEPHQACSPSCAPGEDRRVYAIGYPSQLPAKFSGWADASPAKPGDLFFGGDLDLMPGNSGSPVFNADHQVVGVVNDDGNDAHSADEAAGCRRWMSCLGNCGDPPKIYFVTSRSIPPVNQK